jgi:hypothetical protein
MGWPQVPLRIQRAWPVSRARLSAVYRSTSEYTKEAGRLWYPHALQSCHLLASATGYCVDVVAAIVAVLSPNTRWETNLDDAATVLEYFAAYERGAIEPIDFQECKVSTYNRNRDKAFSILWDCRHELPSRWLAPSNIIARYCKGPKVSAFYAAITGERDALCLDSHCFNAWAGKRVAGSKLNGLRAADRRQCERDFRAAAGSAGEHTRDFQAIIWLRHIERIQLGRVEGYTRIA